jgi:DNA-binding NtrC family response regulator
MIVDDDPEVRMVVAEFLEDFGYQVIQASGGAEALDLLGRTPDLRMIISGYFVSQQVKRRFLRKPFRMRDLEAAVRAELGA